MNDFLRDQQGRSVYVVGVQAHNSSTGTDMLDRAVAAAEQYHANTLEAPVNWYQIEPQKDQYCMDSLRALVDRARQARLRLIVLWFGTSKNGHPNYVPEYVKLAPERYWIASGPDGAPVVGDHGQLYFHLILRSIDIELQFCLLTNMRYSSK